ncbi:hypothetical protein [Petroclostridium sp. X23]|uniref:hypothetical protein n=1 Tax=Petroclostridium sp. X23 TaxID=3045146 RepID=UPI0024AE1AF7|nr:hypothetical protein [Petroclostridium sp. X23]WHH57104.1 hypothetical protein QKW49_14780 [Petroclostridium sp. X23]
MYRRYYQRYDRFGENPQRPIGENTEEESKPQEKTRNEIETKAEPEIIVPEKPSQTDEHPKTKISNVPLRRVSRPSPSGASNSISSFFGRFGIDDLILIGLIFIIFQEQIDDELLLIVLIFLLFAGFNT